MSNLKVACIGDTHVCPIPGHGSSPIIANGATASLDGVPIARHSRSRALPGRKG